MHDPKQSQDEIIDSFSLFSEWLDRYQYLIDLGRKLTPLDEAEKTNDKLLAGCQSQVWLLLEGDAGQVTIRANSDAAIVSGLIALLVEVYSGCSAQQIVDTEPYFIEGNRTQRSPLPDPRQRPPRHAGRHQRPRPGLAHSLIVCPGQKKPRQSGAFFPNRSYPHNRVNGQARPTRRGGFLHVLHLYHCWQPAGIHRIRVR